MPDPFGTLEYLKNALEPKGLIKIGVPNGTGIEQKLRVMDWTAPRGTPHSLMTVHPLEHINCFNRQALLRMTTRAGLNPIALPLNILYISHDLTTLINKPLARVIKGIFRPLLLYYRTIISNSSTKNDTQVFLQQPSKQ